MKRGVFSRLLLRTLMMGSYFTYFLGIVQPIISLYGSFIPGTLPHLMPEVNRSFFKSW